MYHTGATVHDHGASANSSLAFLLSGAAASSITWGSDIVPAFQLALNTVNAEYLAARCTHRDQDAQNAYTKSTNRLNHYTSTHNKKPLREV